MIAVRPAEAALLGVALPLGVGLVAAPALLFVPVAQDPLATFVLQLLGVMLVAFVAAVRVVPLADADWFVATSWPSGRRRFAAVVVLAVAATGLTGLVTLATSAALRLQPSLQLLQLLSALDIAWVMVVAMVGARWKWGERAAPFAGLLVIAMCVGSVWNYLARVGFTPDGGWHLRADDLWRFVLPGDIAIAIAALGLLWLGWRAQPIEQASDQSYG